MSELGIAGKLLASDLTPASAAFQRADLGLVVPSVGTIQYMVTIRQIVRDHHVGLVVPLTDLDLRVLARHRDELAKDGCIAMVGSEPTVMLCRDKSQTNNVLAKAGLASIRTCSLEAFWRKPFYPCFVKPIRGSAGVGTGIIYDEKELKAHVSTYGELLLVQEYVPGQEYTIDVYRTRKGEIKCIVPRQRLVVRGGEVEKGITVRDEALKQATVKLVNNLGDIWGVFCCQCRRQGKGPPRFFEVNPRFGGGTMLSIAAGANLPLYLLQEVCGLPITAQMNQFTDRLLMLRYDEAVFVQVDDSSKLPGFDTPTFR